MEEGYEFNAWLERQTRPLAVPQNGLCGNSAVRRSDLSSCSNQSMQIKKKKSESLYKPKSSEITETVFLMTPWVFTVFSGLCENEETTVCVPEPSMCNNFLKI